MTPSSEPRRVVSLAPGATETIFVLEAMPRLVGVSHECDFPPAVLHLPRVTRPRVDPHLPSVELDAAVKDLARRGESPVELDRAALERIKPDLIVAQTQCNVCAISPKELQTVRDELRPRPDVAEFGPKTYEETLREIRRLGNVLHRPEESKREILKQWGLAKEIRGHGRDGARPRVAVLDWIDPPMLAGHWTQELIEMAGGHYPYVAKGHASRWTSWDEIEESEPDVLIVVPCGRALATAAQEATAAIRKHGLHDLEAFRNGRVFAVDGNKYFNRPGPRLIYSAAIAARAAHWVTVPPLPPAIEAGLVRLAPEGL